MTYRNPAYEADFDFPDHPEPPRRTCLVATTPRSGSSLFAFLCRQTRTLGFPLEYFTPINRQLLEHRLELRAAGLAEFATGLARKRTSPGGTFSFKLHFDELAPFRAAGGLELPFMKAPRVIVLERAARLDQAISLYIASRTNQWIDLPGYQMAGAAAPAYDRAAIAGLATSLARQYDGWTAFLASRGWPVLRLAYEDLLADCAAAFRTVAAFLEVPPEAPRLDAVGLGRQTTPLNRDWAQRFTAGR